MGMNATALMSEDTQRVEVRRKPDPVVDGFGRQLKAAVEADPETDLQRARKLAELMDSKFSVAGIRFGVDSIIGLIPGVGDLVSAAIGMYPLYVAQRHGLGKVLKSRMVANMLVDFVVGAVPLLGDVFDLGFKSNLKNVRLLEKALEKAVAKRE